MLKTFRSVSPVLTAFVVFLCVVDLVANYFSNSFHTCIIAYLQSQAAEKSKGLGLGVRIITSQTACTVHFVNFHIGFFSIFAGILVAGFTYTLWRSTEHMWEASRKQLKISRKALKHTVRADVTTQRAYMSRRSIDSVDVKQFLTDDGMKVLRFEYTPVWENNGSTPAINVRFCAIYPIISVGEPLQGVEPTEIKMGPLPQIAIGSRQTMSGGTVAVEIGDLIKCSLRQCRIFLVFRVEYNDVFIGTPLRIVQYCEELRFSGFHPVTDTPIPIGGNWPFILYGYPQFQIYN